MDYLASVDIREAFKTYKIEFALGSNNPEDILPQTCNFSLLNGPIYGAFSSATLVQQERYFGHDDCIFAGELAYLLIDMRDLAGNVVPITDTEAFYDLFTVEFELGTEFSTRECLQYG